MKLKILLITIIIGLTVFTRFYNLSTLPPSLFSDEVDAGYQALVFNNKGSDYYGNKFPTHFHSFSDWRTSAHIYSIALAQKITHNPELSVRLPSAIFSSLSVLIFYLITKSFFASFLLSISPWAIHFGRTGFEVSGMIFVILLGFYFWQKYLQSHRSINLLLFVFFICLSPYFYSTAKLFLPLILLTILFVWSEDFFKIKPKLIFISLFTALIILSPLIVDTVKGKSGFRFSYISIFTEPHREQVTDQMRYEDIYTTNIGEVGIATPKISFLLHNKYELVIEKFIKNYLSAFSTDFLFIKGDLNLRQGFGGHGMFYFIDLFLIISGLVIYFKHPTKLGRFFLFLLILAPIPFALTRDSISAHSTRLILMLPSLIYFISLNQKFLLYPFYLVLFFNFWHFYTLHYPQISAPYWHANMKEAVLESRKLANGPIYYSDKYEPFLPFYLFYQQYLPLDDSTVKHLTHINNQFFDGTTLDNKYFFGNINWNNISDPSVIFVIPKSEYSALNNQSSFKVLNTISKKYLNSEEFYILEKINVTQN